MKLPQLARLTRPFAHPGAVAAETLLLPLVPVALGLWLSPLDPLWIRADFPWLWFAPVILALRYGPFPGLGAAAVLLFAWLGLTVIGWPLGAFPKTDFLGGLILVMLCGEFSSLWVARTRRAEGVQEFLDQRLEYLTHQYYLLRLSHDRLEQDLLARPMAMRDALAALSAPVDDQQERLAGADRLLRLLAQFCQIEAAGLFVSRDGVIDPNPVASLGQPGVFDGDDPLVRHALENNALSHVAEALAGGDRSSRYIAVAPLNTLDRETIALLTVEQMPFFALNEETLQTLNLLLGYYADGLARERAIAAIRVNVPECPADFAFELQRLWRLKNNTGVSSIIVALDFPNTVEFVALMRQIARQKRGLDELWTINGQRRQLLATLMPLSGDAAAEGYLARIDTWVQQQFGRTLADAGIPAHILPVGEELPEAMLKRLLEICHVAEQTRL